MAIPINKQLDNLYRKKITEVNKAMSARSTFVVVGQENKRKCPNCKWDSVNKASAGTYNGTGPKPFLSRVCPICKNVGEVSTPNNRKLDTANVRWAAPQVKDMPVDIHGKIPEGHARVKVLLKDRPLIENAHNFIVDGFRCTLVGEIRNRGLLTYVMSEFLVKKDK